MGDVGEKQTISPQGAEALNVATQNTFAIFVRQLTDGLLFVFRALLHRFRGITDAGHFFLLLSSERM
jgi:hypothetical protein